MTTKVYTSNLSILLRNVKVPQIYISKENQVSMFAYSLKKRIKTKIGDVVINIFIYDLNNGYYDVELKIIGWIPSIQDIVNELSIQPQNDIEIIKSF